MNIDMIAGTSQEPLPGTSQEATSIMVEPPEHEKELNEQFLHLIGERRLPDRVLNSKYACSCHQKDVAIRWEETIRMGLPEKE